MKRTVLCVFLFIAFCSYSDERSLTFGDLLKINESDFSDLKMDDSIKISGFLYKDTAHNIFLSNTPSLKSCCVGHYKEGIIQIRVLDLPIDTSIKEGELRQLKGLLAWDRTEKNLLSFYLKKSELLDKSKAKSLILPGAVFTLFLLSFIVLKGIVRYRKI